MLWLVLALTVIGFAIGWPMTAVMRAVGTRLGALDSAGARGHEKQLRPIPNTGGVAVYLAVAVPLLGGLLALTILGKDGVVGLVPQVEPYWNRLMEGEGGGRSSYWTAVALLSCLTLLHVVGLVDDRKSLGPLLKLGAQVAAALVMTLWFDVRLLELLDAYVPYASVFVTVCWIVVITNAINFLDNMDGLAGGVSAIAATLLLAATILNGQWFIAATLALLIGGVCGFLVFNFPPAKIFMGDSGSLVIGFLLAVLTARTTFYHAALGGGWYGVFMPVVILAIPLYDFTSVTIIRLRQGKSPLVGDQQHFSHRLVQRGISKRGAVIVIWCFAAVTGIGGISLGRLELWQAILVFVQTGLILLTIAIIEYASRRKNSTHGP